MARVFLIAAQFAATVLFIAGLTKNPQHWSSWLPPMILIFLVVVNSFWFTRLVSWLIFAVAFFALLILLSTFTLRWRLEPGFSSTPFYRSMGMYAAFVYVSLGQLKLLGGQRQTKI